MLPISLWKVTSSRWTIAVSTTYCRCRGPIRRTCRGENGGDLRMGAACRACGRDCVDGVRDHRKYAVDGRCRGHEAVRRRGGLRPGCLCAMGGRLSCLCDGEVDP